MAKFFLWSRDGDAAFLLRRFQSEGHRVRAYIQRAKDAYQGIIPVVTSPEPKKDEVVIFDTVGHGKEADRLRRRGFLTVGGSEFSDTIELDRWLGIELMRKLGIKTPDTYPFKRVQEGLKFLSGKPGRWFYKPYGNQDAGDTFGGDVDNVAEFMEYAEGAHKPAGFLLQRHVEGTEISIEGWFDGRRFVYPFNSTVEDKKFMTGDKGKRVGCAANVVWAYDEPKTTLATRTVSRVADVLASVGYVGPIDANVVIDSNGDPYGLEWTPRFGYYALQSLMMLTDGDLGLQFEAFAQGKLDAFSTSTEELSMGLGVTVDPYPHEENDNAKDLPIEHEMLNDHRVLLGDVKLTKFGKLRVAGPFGCVACMMARGTSVGQLRTDVVKLADTYWIPNAQYRTDPVKRYEDVVSKLAKYGYDTPRLREVAHADTSEVA